MLINIISSVTIAPLLYPLQGIIHLHRKNNSKIINIYNNTINVLYIK